MPSKHIYRKFPFIIGVAGNSGSGKTYLVESLLETLFPKQVLVIHGDNYHKWARGDEHWKEYTHLNPKTNHLDRMARHLQDLKQGKSIESVVYNHDTGQFDGPYRFEPTPIIIVDGLHTLYSKEIRKSIDFKIFIHTRGDLNDHWKFLRDIKKRGYTKEKIYSVLEQRRPDLIKYILPQGRHADLTVRMYPCIPIREDKEDIPIAVNFVYSNEMDLHPLRKVLEKVNEEKIQYYRDHNNHGIEIRHIMDEDELQKMKETAKKECSLNIKRSIQGMIQLVVCHTIVTRIPATLVRKSK